MEKMIAERYMVVASLGEGGMADVYLAIDTILNREVAVKVLRGEQSEDPVSLLRFLREAEAVCKMHHPNIVEVYDVGEYDGKNYIVMEYVRGRTLKQLIAQRGALTKEEAVEIMLQLVSALVHAHEKNIIHRDIKPQNVLVKDDGTVKITDFGIALAHDAVQLTQSDSVLGSAHYIAPETTRGEPATVQIDIYALGIVFYELLTGSVPFKGDNPVQIAMKHLREDVPSVKEFNPTLPQTIDNIIIKATAKNRKYRYAVAKDMLYDLEMCLLPELADVEKVEFESEKEAASGTVVLDNVQDLEYGDATVEVDDEDVRRLKRKGTQVSSKQHAKTEKHHAKDNAKRKKIWLAIGLVFLLIGGTAGVYYSGIIPAFSPVKTEKVPDLEGLTEKQAKRILEERGFLLGKVKSEVTDDVEEGLIIKQSVKKGRELQLGSPIDITVSSGMYFVIDDYTGLTLEEVENLLPDYITIIKEYQTSSTAKAGTVISQSVLQEGDKVKPGVSSQIKLIIASYPQFVMADYTGAKIETAKATLEQLGAKVVLQKMDVPKKTVVDEETGEEKEVLEEVEYGVVIKQTPEVGSYYTQEGNNVVTLYYY